MIKILTDAFSHASCRLNHSRVEFETIHPDEMSARYHFVAGDDATCLIVPLSNSINLCYSRPGSAETVTNEISAESKHVAVISGAYELWIMSTGHPVAEYLFIFTTTPCAQIIAELVTSKELLMPRMHCMKCEHEWTCTAPESLCAHCGAAGYAISPRHDGAWENVKDTKEKSDEA